jgi:hypothetical protein
MQIYEDAVKKKDLYHFVKTMIQKTKQTPWPEAASELYRQSDPTLVSELSANF